MKNNKKYPKNINLLREQLKDLNPYTETYKAVSLRRAYLYDLLSKSAEVKDLNIKVNVIDIKILKKNFIFSGCKESVIKRHIEHVYKAINKKFKETEYWNSSGKNNLSLKDISKLRKKYFSKAAYSISNKPVYKDFDPFEKNLKEENAKLLKEYLDKGGKIIKVPSRKKCPKL